MCRVYSEECKVKSVECIVYSVKCSVWSAKCSARSVWSVWSVWSAECSVNPVRGVECKVMSVSVECGRYSVACRA